jgi:hypothetical protein
MLRDAPSAIDRAVADRRHEQLITGYLDWRAPPRPKLVRFDLRVCWRSGAMGLPWPRRREVEAGRLAVRQIVSN